MTLRYLRELGSLPTLAHPIIPERDWRLDELAKPITLDVSEVCDHVVGLVGEDEARPSYFQKEATADAHALHDAQHEITLDAEEAVRYEYHGEGWNNFVYAPLCIPGRGDAEAPPARYGSNTSGSFACSISVESPSIDSASDAGTHAGSSIYAGMHSRRSSNKVDYVVAVSLGDDDAPRQNVLFMHLHNGAVERGLIPHVNQTLDRPLSGYLAQVDAAVTAVFVRAGAGAVVRPPRLRAATVDGEHHGRVCVGGLTRSHQGLG
ncbi:hypothetical protein F5X98DRAFT_379294 [Xylaria grammica]|nr:hypothetical protein F5X98DRAFT_379294 [Xylaria grammica]